MNQEPITQLLEFFEDVNGKLSTPKKREVARKLLEAFLDRKGKVKAWEMGNEIIPEIREDLGISEVYAYKVLGELIELGLIAKTLKGYELSPLFRKRLYRLYKALGDLL